MLGQVRRIIDANATAGHQQSGLNPKVRIDSVAGLLHKISNNKVNACYGAW